MSNPKPRGVGLELVEGWRNHKGERIERGVRVRVGTNFSIVPVEEFVDLIANLTTE
ncbi:hypothetical protein [Gordonia humi]|uniref:Uncharacterized protein n=1 Tax=Gordonia humi TaxID=686429 RepID=A0A840EXY7_9ACTN|nr:hypothetical protein [Gordonia humi]MBB4134646.1 hypothetical protein [Gordonia humi]